MYDVLRNRYVKVRDATPPQAHCSLKSIVMMSHVQGLKLVGPWASGLGTWSEVACFIGPTALAQTSLNAHLKPKDHNGAIITWMAKAKPYQSTLT